MGGNQTCLSEANETVWILTERPVEINRGRHALLALTRGEVSPSPRSPWISLRLVAPHFFAVAIQLDDFAVAGAGY